MKALTIIISALTILSSTNAFAEGSCVYEKKSNGTISVEVGTNGWTTCRLNEKAGKSSGTDSGRRKLNAHTIEGGLSVYDCTDTVLKLVIDGQDKAVLGTENCQQGKVNFGICGPYPEFC